MTKNLRFVSVTDLTSINHHLKMNFYAILFALIATVLVVFAAPQNGAPGIGSHDGGGRSSLPVSNQGKFLIILFNKNSKLFF